MNRVTKLLTCLLIGLFLANGDAFVPKAAAQDGSIFRDPTGRTVLDGGSYESQDGYTRPVPFGTRYRILSQIGDGVGWNDGQTYFSVFHPFHITPWVDLVFVDVRGFAAYENSGDGLGANVGLGYRRYVKPWNTVFGLSAWGDVDGAHVNTFYQGGVSAEVITPVMEYRVNGYIGIGKKTHTLAEGFLPTTQFQQNFIYLNSFKTTENSFEGVDAELGGPLPYIGQRGFNFYVGGYYLRNHTAGTTAGGKLRGEVVLNENLQLGYEYRYDDIFKSSFFGNVMFEFPNSWRDWFRKPFFVQRTPAMHLARQVERNYRIPVNIQTKQTANLLLDGHDGSPLIVLHVNPDGAAGDGTVEHPFNSSNFSNRSDANIIRVLPGNFELPGTLNLFDNQRLLAANHSHLFVSNYGVHVLPGQVVGPNPTISNTGGMDVVRLANFNEVSGFDVLGRGRIGVIGDNIVDFNLNRLNIRGGLHGIQITNFHDSGVPAPWGQRNLIQDVTVSGSSMNGVALNLNDGGTGSVWVNRLNSGGNAHHGLSVTASGNSNVNLVLTGSYLGDGNGLPGNGQDGFNFAANSGTHNLIIGGDNVIDGNIFSGNGQRGADILLSGTAVASITAINNTFGVGGMGGGLTIGTNFTGSSLATSGFIPPDTMGAVGPAHIVELINGMFAVYDKNGNPVQSSTLDAFFAAAGATIPAGNGTFDPRIIYDPQSGRWFAVAIDGGAANRIYVAVSNTSDPTQGWRSVQFVGDTVAGTRFNDFDMLGINSTGLYISTNNFVGATTDVSLYVIPKADLLAAVPSAANLTRFENQAVGSVGFSPFPAINTSGTAPGTGNFLSASSSGVLTLTNTTGVGPATLQASVNIAVPAYAVPGFGKQPGPNDNLEIDDTRIGSAPVRVGNSIWAVHGVQGTAGNAVVRWYEIDATTNALKQSGTISDPNLDLSYPSIAVNPRGDVVIGFSGSGNNQAISTYAAVGRTNGGVTTFGSPTLLKQGNGTYNVDFGGGRNRWGDYSATVVDPTNPNTFWTFQEFVNGNDNWAVQITQLRLGGLGNTLDGLRVNLRNSAQLNNSRFDRNTFDGNGAIGMNLEAYNTAMVNSSSITNNLFANNVTGLMLSANDMSVINANVVGNTFTNNSGMNTGFHALANGGTINLMSLINNNAANNTGNGFRLEAVNGGLLTIANVFGNVASGNSANGMFIRAQGGGSRVLGSIGIAGLPINSFTGNTLAGLRIEAVDDGSVLGSDGVSAFGILSVNASNNSRGGLDALVNGTGNGRLALSINQSNFDANSDFGARVRAEQSGVLSALLVSASSFTNTIDNPATTAQRDGAGEGLLLSRGDFAAFGGGGGVNVGAIGFGNLFMGNAGDGLRVFGEGHENVVNQVNVNSNMFLSNVAAGMHVDQTADSVFVYNVMCNAFVSNQDGVRIRTANNASVGNIYTFNPANTLASAAVFDGNGFFNNSRDGFLIETPLANNQSWQNIAIVGLTRRTVIADSGRNGITINNNATPTVDGVGPQQNIYTIQGTDITRSAADGINIQLTGGESALFPEHNLTRAGTNVVNLGGPAAGQDVSVTDSGGQGVQVAVNHLDTGMFNNLPTISLISGTDTFNVDSLVSARNASDGFQVVQTGLSDVTFNMFRSAMVQNGGVGLSVNINSANANFVLASTTSVYNIGSDVAGSGNLFANNTLQGVFFQALSPVMDGGNIALLPVIANTFLSLDPQVPQVFLTSGLYADARNADDFTFTTGRLNFFGNTVRDNGTTANMADGVALSVGTNTRVYAAISQNTFAGNQGADLNIVNVVSQNPGASINNIVANTDLLSSDPIGQLDLALGLNFVGVDPPVSGEAPTGALPNIGEHFRISTIGITTSLAGRTELGIFTNTDLIKPANRNSFMLVRVYDANPSVLNQNVFTQSGPVITTLMNANFNVGGGGNPPGGPIPTFDTIQFQPLGAVFP